VLKQFGHGGFVIMFTSRQVTACLFYAYGLMPIARENVMWGDWIKRWTELLFWWVPRHDSGAEEQQPRPSTPAAPPRKPQAEPRWEPESVAEPEPKPTPEQPSEPAPKAATASPDDLTVIKGIGPAMQDRLQALNVRTFADLAAADPDDLAARLRKAQAVVSKARVEAWIETAKEHGGG
jgi:predicted flap endonuclease-1-like 5' DNA nuclease